MAFNLPLMVVPPLRTRLILGRLGVIVSVASLSGCLRGPALLQSSGSIQSTELVVLSVTEDDGAATGDYDPDHRGDQLLRASATSAISGASVLFPAGALSFPLSVTIEEGVSIANASVATEIGLTSLGDAGAAVVLSAGASVNTDAPLVLSLPLPQISALSLLLSLLDDPYAKMAVIYRVVDAATGKTETGVIPRREVEIKDGKAVVTTTRFGTFQTVVLPEDEVTERKKVESEVKQDIITKRTERLLPQISDQLTLSPGPSGKVGERTEVVLSGSNFKEHLKLSLKNAAGIWKIKTKLKVSSEGSTVSFYYPSDAPEGVQFDLVVEQSGVERVIPAPPFDKSGPGLTVVVQAATGSPSWTNDRFVKSSHQYDVTVTVTDYHRLGMALVDIVGTAGNASASVTTPSVSGNQLVFSLKTFAGNGALAVFLKPGAFLDDAGNGSASTPVSSFRVDNTPPLIEMNSPILSASKSGIQLNPKISDAGAGQIVCSWTASAVTFANSSQCVTIATVTGNGDKTVTIEARDAIGNSSSFNAILRVNDIAPTLSVVKTSVGLTNGFATTADVEFLLNYTGASRIDIGPGKVTISKEGDVVASVKSVTVVTQPTSAKVVVAITSGSGIIGLNVDAGTAFNDVETGAPSGNLAPTAAQGLVVDNAKPEVSSFVVPAPGVFKSAFTPTGAATDAGGSGMDPVSWAAEGTPAANIDITQTPLMISGGTTQGTYRVKVTAVDKAGNSNSKILQFEWDTVAPPPPAVAPASGIKFAQNFDALISTTETNVKFAVNGPSNSIPADPNCAGTLSTPDAAGNLAVLVTAPTGPGTKYLKVVTCDLAGNASILVVREFVAAAPDEAPANLAAAPSERKIDLAWSAVPRATAYEITQSNLGTVTVFMTSYSAAGLTDGTSYMFTICGKNQYGTATGAQCASITETAGAQKRLGRPSQINSFKKDSSWDVVSYREGLALKFIAHSSGLIESSSDSWKMSSVNLDSAASEVSLDANTDPSVPDVLIAESQSEGVALHHFHLPTSGTLSLKSKHVVFAEQNLIHPSVSFDSTKAMFCVAAAKRFGASKFQPRLRCGEIASSNAALQPLASLIEFPPIEGHGEVTDLRIAPSATAGQFNLVISTSAKKLFSWLVSPRSWGALPTGADPLSLARSAGFPCTAPCTVYSAVTYKGALYVGGAFMLVDRDGQQVFSSLARFSVDGWESVGEANQPVKALAVSPNGSELYAGGAFTTINNIPAPYIAAFDGITWTPVPPAGAPTAPVSALAFDSYSDLFVGAGDIYKLSAGSWVTHINLSGCGEVRSIKVDLTNKVHIATATICSAQPLSGPSVNYAPVGTAAMAVGEDGLPYAAGAIVAGGGAAPFVKKWTTTLGAEWSWSDVNSNLLPSSGFLPAAIAAIAGHVFVAGNDKIVRLNGTTWTVGACSAADPTQEIRSLLPTSWGLVAAGNMSAIKCGTNTLDNTAGVALLGSYAVLASFAGESSSGFGAYWDSITKRLHFAQKLDIPVSGSYVRYFNFDAERLTWGESGDVPAPSNAVRPFPLVSGSSLKVFWSLPGSVQEASRTQIHNGSSVFGSASNTFNPVNYPGIVGDPAKVYAIGSSGLQFRAP
ncbi:MAG: hypothetical protein RIQ81_1681 [Pseudomonadota bacterium]|jgi:hypothetical protein